MSEEPKQPRRRLGLTGILLIAIAVVIVSTLVVVLGICSGGRLTARAPLEKPFGHAALMLPLFAPRGGNGAWTLAYAVPLAVLLGAVAAALALWLA